MLRRIIGVALGILIIAVVVSPTGRGTVSALLLLPEFFPGAPVRPLQLLTPAPERSTVQLSYDGKTAVGDLYLPGTPGKHGAVVIFLGVAPAGRDDPRVVRLGEGLARVGIVTLIPQSQDLVDSKVDPTEVDEVVSAFQYLAARPDVAADRIGIGGFCIGAGLSLDAAEDPRINRQVALVNSFTGYDDLSTYAVSILSHSVAPYPPEPGQARVPWEPSANATTVLDDHLISLDPHPAEVARLRAAAHDPKAP
ncbi:MAG TPA: dienelactone hydrolase family protein, partial [Chloroflexota bacterium]|nr:dienelactone hydrolase family protein [Chloroflexota bacterium]